MSTNAQIEQYIHDLGIKHDEEISLMGVKHNKWSYFYGQTLARAGFEIYDENESDIPDFAAFHIGFGVGLRMQPLQKD